MDERKNTYNETLTISENFFLTLYGILPEYEYPVDLVPAITEIVRTTPQAIWLCKFFGLAGVERVQLNKTELEQVESGIETLREARMTEICLLYGATNQAQVENLRKLYQKLFGVEKRLEHSINCLAGDENSVGVQEDEITSFMRKLFNTKLDDAIKTAVMDEHGRVMRLYNALCRGGIGIFFDVLRRGKEYICERRNFGRSCLEALECVMEAQGLKWSDVEKIDTTKIPLEVLPISSWLYDDQLNLRGALIGAGFRLTGDLMDYPISKLQTMCDITEEDIDVLMESLRAVDIHLMDDREIKPKGNEDGAEELAFTE